MDIQVQLSVTGTDDQAVFLPRPERPNGGDHDDAAEQQRLAMAYRFHPEFAVGSGVAVHADVTQDNPLRAKEIHTRTVPDYEIPATDVPRAYERGNQYLDRALLVDTLATTGCGLFS